MNYAKFLCLGHGKQFVDSDFPKMKFPKKFTEVIQGLGNI